MPFEHRSPKPKSSVNPKTEHKTDIGFRPAGSQQLIPLIYNHGRNNVRVIHLGTLVHSGRSDFDPATKPPKQTFPIVFDGSKKKYTKEVAIDVSK